MSMTDDQRTAIDGDASTVRRSIHISAPIEKVGVTITEPEHISKWFTRSAVLDGTGVGATGIVTFRETNSIPVRIEEIDAPRMIAYRWSNDDAAAMKAGGVRPDTIDDTHSLLMRFTLEPTVDGTRQGQRVGVRSGGVPASDSPGNCQAPHRASAGRAGRIDARRARTALPRARRATERHGSSARAHR